MNIEREREGNGILLRAFYGTHKIRSYDGVTIVCSCLEFRITFHLRSYTAIAEAIKVI